MSASTRKASENGAQAAAPSAPGAGAPADPHYERRWLILLVVMVVQVMILLDATVMNVALPSAQHDLGFSNATRQWVVTAYTLSFGSLLPFGGRLADVFGRKRMFLTGSSGSPPPPRSAGRPLISAC